MKTHAFTTARDDRPRSILRQLAVPMIVAALLCGSLFFAATKWLRPEPVREVKAKWIVTWVELSNFQKPRDAAQKKQR